jgi:Trypsin-co-occurring domain 2
MSPRGCLTVVLSALLCLPSARASAQQPPPGQTVLVDQVLTEIQTALAKAQKELVDARIPPLQSVTLDLVTEAKRDAGGKINLFIVSFGRKWEKDRSQEIEVTLKPPSPTLPLKVANTPSLSDQLVTAIVSAGRGVQTARANKDVPLVATGLKVTLSFVIKTDTSGGLKFVIAPVTADLSGDLSNSAVQKITISYQNPEPKPEPKK